MMTVHAGWPVFLHDLGLSIDDDGTGNFSAFRNSA